MKAIKVKKIKNNILALVSFLLFANFVHAHDPAEHAKKSEKPDCAAIESMNQSGVDKNDPVLMAIMIKCKKIRQSDMTDYHTSEQTTKEVEHDTDHHGKSKESSGHHFYH
ncbi:hypothetical protein [Nitrococcus mobilis]|uniref:hypothetical protein n=1 Tax=Nitrococcus mobilis TaxID=35797 RepID=UPI0012E9C08B|nr:hypothetical protein [Nitrococcus mobilis]